MIQILIFCVTLLNLQNTWALEPSKSVLSPQKIEIDQIEVQGVTLFSAQEVQSVIEISPGDLLERIRLVRSAQNLQDLYRAKGYAQAQVQSSLSKRIRSGSNEVVLIFKVEEGLPTRIKSVELSITLATSEQQDERILKSWQQIEPTLLARIGIQEGEILDQEKLANARRSIQDYLASLEYIGAFLEPWDVVQIPEKSSDAANWVKVLSRVSLGERVSFGFRGNDVFNRTQLLAFVEEQRQIGFGKDYVQSITDRLAYEYRNQGYGAVRIRHFSFEKGAQAERHVTFDILEGERQKIESITFDGNYDFSTEALTEKLNSFLTPAVQKGFYVEKDFEKGVELVSEWMRSQGYLSSKLVTITKTYLPKKKSYRILVYLYEGTQTIVKSVSVKTEFKDEVTEIQALLGAQPGKPLNLYLFNEGLEHVKARFRGRGYLDFNITNEEDGKIIRYSSDQSSADVVVEIFEGSQYRASRVEILGLSKTREHVVRREVSIKSGDVIEDWRVTEIESRIRKLGLFSSVRILATTDDEKENHKIIRIEVEEGTPGIVAGGIGQRKDLGTRVFGQLGYNNFLGENHSILLSTALNWRKLGGERCGDGSFRDNPKCSPEIQASLAYVWPWFGLDRMYLTPRLTIEKTQYLEFDSASLSASMTLEKNLIAKPNLTASMSYSLERTQISHADEFDNQQLTIGYITPALRLDLRDNPLSPTKGLYALTSYEIASPSLGSQANPFPVGYTRFQFRSDYFIPVSIPYLRTVALYLSFRTGYEQNTQTPPTGASDEVKKDYRIPINKQFVLGGAGSVRGYADQEINEQRNVVVGSLSYVNYRTQIDVPIAGALRLGPFLDAANLNISEGADNRFSFTRGLKFGAGIGLHYQSPIGPVNFDWGFKLNPDADDRNPKDRIYFSIGVI